MNLLLLTTGICSEAFLERIDRLVQSVDGNLATSAGAGLRLRHVLLVQNPDRQDLTGRLPQRPWLEYLHVGQKMSLSAARNLLIAHVRTGTCFGNESFVLGFPDDDAWYPEGVFDALMNFGQAAAANGPRLFVCRYASTPKRWDGRLQSMQSAVTFSRCASSNTMFFWLTAPEGLGHFDERLGVGARLNGGEDLDYALRAWGAQGGFAFSPLELVGHRDKERVHLGRYYVGSLLAIAKAVPQGMRFRWLYWRKLAVGVALVVLRELTPREFWQAVRVSRDTEGAVR